MTTTILPDIRLSAGKATPGAAGEDFVMPCSISQQRFWVLDQLTSGNSALNIPLALELKGPLDVEALHKALHAVIQRHETLRTSFIWQDDEVKQVIASDVRFYFQQKDLTDVPENQREEALLKEMNTEALRPLSLTKAPILRVKLLHLEVEYHALLLTLHHIICDGWANGVLVREIGVYYHAILEGRPAALPDLPIHYADYAVWQREWVKTPDFQNQLAYWEKELTGSVPVLDFPTDHPRRTGRMFPSYIESHLLSAQLTEGIKKLCQDLDVTNFMVLYATYAILLHRYTGQSRFVVGTTVANRTRPELEHLIGEFANPLILRADLTNEPTFREFVHRVRDMSLGAMSHQEVPFESILERLESQSGGRDKPAFQAFFLFQKAFMQPAKYGELSIRPFRSVSPGTTFEFTLAIVERAEGIRLQMEYNTELLENATVRRLLRNYETLLKAALENPDAPVSELTLLTEEESAKAWPTLPPKDTSSKAVRPILDSHSILKELKSQLIEHFREAAEPNAAVVKTPPGAVLVVLDAHLRLLPVGVPGEVCLGGVLPETVPANALVSGPLDSPSPVPLLRTKFVGRNREDGKIEIMGETGDFATISGFRVNLRQVKALLLRHPDVEEVAAAAFRQPTGENHLVCYVVPRHGLVPAEKTLHALLSGKISDPTLPTHIMLVSTLLKDAEGEPVVEFLPEPASSSKSSQSEKVPLEAILYQQMIEIWIEILKVPSVTVDDNFFALGGTSLLALRMMVQIEKLCGRPIPLSLLLTGATIANLARYIVEENSESVPPVVTIQPKGTRRPLFFLHGDWAGGGFYCNRLSQLLGEDQPFYALTPYRLGKQKVLTMQAMAAYHIAAMREHTPHGPYLVGGYCIGATVAIEMARQLVAMGEKVTYLLLVDPPMWGTPWLRWVWPFIDKTGEILKWDLQKKIYYFDLYAVSLARWLRRSPHSKLISLFSRLGLTQSASPSPVAAGREPSEGDEEILKSMDYAVYFLAYRLYRARLPNVPATLYFSEETPPARFAQVKQMGETAPVKFSVEILPGNHRTCIIKYTPELVEKMKKTMEQLQG
jgi:pimeloyl-ACP methyl ester carboxylesterase